MYCRIYTHYVRPRLTCALASSCAAAAAAAVASLESRQRHRTLVLQAGLNVALRNHHAPAWYSAVHNGEVS